MPTADSSKLRFPAIFSLSVLAWIAATALGCSYQLVSPPARMVNLETAQTLAKGESAVSARTAAYAAVFDPGADVASVGLSHGLTDHVQIDGSATYAYVTDDQSSDIDRSIYAARVAVKVSNPHRWIAAFAGVGGGTSPAAGNFAAADLGTAISYATCVVTPFANAAVFASVPFDAKQVDFHDQQGMLVASDTADTTYGFSLGAGLAIPLSRQRCREELTPPRLQIGLAVHQLYPSDGTIRTVKQIEGGTETTERGGHYGVVGLGAGVEIPF